MSLRAITLGGPKRQAQAEPDRCTETHIEQVLTVGRDVWYSVRRAEGQSLTRWLARCPLCGGAALEPLRAGNGTFTGWRHDPSCRALVMHSWPNGIGFCATCGGIGCDARRHLPDVSPANEYDRLHPDPGYTIPVGHGVLRDDAPPPSEPPVPAVYVGSGCTCALGMAPCPQHGWAPFGIEIRQPEPVCLCGLTARRSDCPLHGSTGHYNVITTSDGTT